jgi:hypothetical protein
VRTFQDFSKQVDSLLDGSVKQITEQARTETNAARQRLHAVVDELQRSTDATRLRVEEARGRVEEVRAESERFMAQFPEVRKLAGEVAGLSTKVQQIEDKISIAYRGALTKAEAKTLSETLESFRAYMRDIGFHDQPGSLKVVVRRELEGGSPAYYSPNEHRMYVASPLGTGFIGPKSPQGQLGVDLPCAVHFITTRGRPSQDALTSGRLDWIATNSDRIFLRVQGEQGLGAFGIDSISPAFDSDYDVSLWQGQLVETHSFSSAAANQFLIAGSDHSFFCLSSYSA